MAAVLALGQQDPRETFEVWLCPVHLDEQAVEPGSCPICGRDLVERHLVYSYSCTMHPHLDEEESGSCPICHMNLVRLARQVEWYCAANPREVSTVPGVCAVTGEPMVSRHIPLAHGDHNPRHGGVLFMAPDRYHHLEGVLSREGAFRLYFYDDFTKPISAVDFPARVGDQQLRATEGQAFSIVNLAGGYPAEVTLHVQFPHSEGDEADGEGEGEGEEVRFDFVFLEEMVDEVAELRMFSIPADGDSLMREIRRRDDYLRRFMERGAWPDLHVPALQAKDLALALIDLEGSEVALPGKGLVQGAWLLDIYGDQGNREAVEKAYGRFEQALRGLEAARAR